MRDNDPKHTSHKASVFFQSNGINWWCTPPESPDLNPVENMWHELKEHLRARVKPHNQAEFVAGIEGFWNTVRHIYKVIPRVIELKSDASGY